MKIVICVEGGGNSADQQRQLRYAFQALLQSERENAGKYGHNIEITPGGGRNETFKKFCALCKTADVALLLVDSESPIACGSNAKTDADVRKKHLIDRDRWSELATCNGINIHLMTQTMETWIVADPDALQNFYGNKFLPDKLPRRQNLEDHPKNDIARDLEAATRDTVKGRYHKINHVKQIFEGLDRDKIEKRCRRFSFFLARLGELLKPPSE